MYEASKHYGEILESNPYVKRRMLQGLNLIKYKLRKGSSVLDIGGYMGDMLELMKQGGVRVEDLSYSIVDYDMDAMEIAKKRGARVSKIDFNVPLGEWEKIPRL